MSVDLLLGLQWGDEGKGKIVDVLTPNYDIIARFQGGPNAGHTLEFEGVKHVLHTIPSGIFRSNVINVIGNGVVIDPIILKKEIDALAPYQINIKEKLLISRKAHIILPTHRLLDLASETSKGKAKIGSTLKGIGPCYMDKTGRNGLRIGDLEKDNFLEEYRSLVEKHLSLINYYGVEIEFDFVTLPVVKTNIDYKKVGVKLDKLEPSTKDLKEVQNNLVEKYVVQEEVEDAIKNSDTVNFDFTGFVDGVEFEGGKAEGFDLVIGSKQFIAGFEDQMIGLKKGEEKDIKVRFPKDYHAQHLADKEAIFKIKINFIKRPSYPKIDEKFLQEINFEGIKTLKDFNEYVRIQALKDKIVKVQNEFIGKVIDKINKDATINIHKKLVDDEKQRMYNDFLNKLKEQQISEDEYFEVLLKNLQLKKLEKPQLWEIS